MLTWVLRRLDLDSFRAVLAGADVGFLLLVPLAIAGEQLVRAWKWRQLLYPMRSVGTLHLFGTIMAGYLAGLLIPFGFGALTRAWLVARREGLAMTAVLATRCARPRDRRHYLRAPRAGCAAPRGLS